MLALGGEKFVVGWFDGPSLDDPRELEFLTALTHDAAEGVFSGVSPDDTELGVLARPGGAGIAVRLTVPGLTCNRRHLIVSYEPGPVHGTPVLQSEWTPSTQLTIQPSAFDGPFNDVDLWVSGIAATPTVCAGWVSAWLSRQLRRPVGRREWDQPESGPGAGLFGRRRAAAAVVWWIDEPNQWLDSRGTFGRWLLTRQPPTREVQERP